MLLALSTFSSCSEEVVEQWEDDAVIRFDSKEDAEGSSKGAASRAGTFANGDAFGVTGAYYKPETSTTQTPIFENTEVTYSNGKWTYQGARVWVDKQVHKFRAFFPYADQQGNPDYVLKNTFGATDSYELVNFIVKDEVSQQRDLMVSEVVTRDLVNTTGPTAYAPVSFTFSHLLTKVNVKLKINNESMNKRFSGGWKVKKLYVKLYGMKTKGTCVSGVWDTAKSPINEVGFTKFITSETGLFVSPTEVVIWNGTGEDGLLMIPQTDFTEIKCELGYFVDYTEAGATKQTFISSIMPVPPTPTWDKAKQLMYTATVDPSNDIKFLAPKVEPWSVSKNSNSVVIK